MFIFILKYLCLIHFFCNEVVIPIKHFFPYKNEKNYNSTLFLEDNLLFSPYTFLNIGHNSQKVLFLFAQNKTDISCHIDNNIINYNNFSYSFYDSDSYEIINEIDIKGEKIKKYLIKDYIELYEDISLNKKTKTKIAFNFFQENNMKLNKYCFEIGFPINKNLHKINSSTFIKQLKSNNIIDNYKISLLFNSSIEGFYIIGNFLHDLNITYKDFQLISIYSIPNNPLFQFQIIFDNIFVINKNSKEELNKVQLNSNKIYFNLDLGLIIGTKEYFDEINKLFFNYYYENKICKLETVKKNIYDSQYSMIRLKHYEIISCLRNNINDKYYFNIELFPSLFFYLKENDFTCEFNYKDLFEEKNGIYYFKVIYSLNENKEWQFGKTFFEKYPTTFDIESRKIYFYNKNILFKKMNNIKKKENSNLLIIMCIFLSIILMGITFYLGKKIYRQRKLRKNEINDNFDYKSFLSEGKRFNNNKLFEMNIQN